MLNAFVYDDVAVIVRHWFEIDLADSHLEHGARVELRLRAAPPHRGSESAAQRVELDQPAWRADLFDRLDGPPGEFAAAHFHPYFTGVEPCERHWADAIKADPWTWLQRQLIDLPRLLADAGVQLGDPERDAESVRADAPDIVAAAKRRAPNECRSKHQCYSWSSDASDAVQLMLGALRQPELLDRDRASPWLR